MAGRTGLAPAGEVLAAELADALHKDPAAALALRSLPPVPAGLRRPDPVAEALHDEGLPGRRSGVAARDGVLAREWVTPAAGSSHDHGVLRLAPSLGPAELNAPRDALSSGFRWGGEGFVVAAREVELDELRVARERRPVMGTPGFLLDIKITEILAV